MKTFKFEMKFDLDTRTLDVEAALDTTFDVEWFDF